MISFSIIYNLHKLSFFSSKKVLFIKDWSVDNPRTFRNLATINEDGPMISLETARRCYNRAVLVQKENLGRERSTSCDRVL